MKSRIFKVFGVVATSAWLCYAGYGAGAQPLALSRENVVELIRKQKILKDEAPLSADIQGNEVDLVTVRRPSAKDNDCKIDSMLMAKSLMQAYPGQVMRLKVQFGYIDRDDVDEVTVTAGEVKAYGAGAMSERELLASLDMQSKHAIDVTADKNSDAVKPGPAKETRMLILGYIEELRGQGTDVKPFEGRLKQIEDSIGTADSATIREQCLDLKRYLTDEEALIRDGKNIQREHPVLHKPETPQAAAAAGPAMSKAASSFNAQLFHQTQRAINQLRKSGTDTSAYRQKMVEIQTLRANGRLGQAQSVLDALASQVGAR